MRQLRKILLTLPIAVGLGLVCASAASAQVTFLVSPSGARPVRAEGLTEATGLVGFAANSSGVIKVGSMLSLDYGTAAIGGAVATTCTGGATISRSTSGNVLTLTVTGADLTCALGQSITVSGARVNANALGPGTNVNVTVSVVVPAAFQATNPIALAVFGTLTVATVQALPSTTVSFTPGAITFCTASTTVANPVAVTFQVTENFAQAFLSRTDETGLGPDGFGGMPVRFRLRFTLTGIPVGVKVTAVNPGTSSGTLAFGAPDPVTFTSTPADQANDFDIEITATSPVAIETAVVRFDFSVPEEANLTTTDTTGIVRLVLRGSTDFPEAPVFSTAPASRQVNDQTVISATACADPRAIISAVTATSITKTGATINWTTNEAADSQVDFGLTAAYGTQSTLDTNMVTSHSVQLTGLTASTPFHFRARSRDSGGTLTASGDFTFTTAAPSPGTGITFQLSANPRQVRAEGITEATGPVVLSANTGGTIKVGTIFILDYGASILVGSGLVSTSCTGGSFIKSGGGTTALATVTGGDLSCSMGNTITVSGVRINANALGAGNSSSVNVAASVPTAFETTNQVTFSQSGPLTVANVQAAPSTTVVLNPAGGANISLCNVQPNVLLASLTVTVTGNFAQAFLSRTDETGLGPDGLGGQPAQFRLRFRFTTIPVGVKITPVALGQSSATLTFSAFDPLTYTSVAGAQDRNFDLQINTTDTTAIETAVVRFDFSVPDTSASAFPQVGGTANLRLTFRGAAEPPGAPVFLTDPASRQFDGPALSTLACVSQRRRGQLTSE